MPPLHTHTHKHLCSNHIFTFFTPHAASQSPHRTTGMSEGGCEELGLRKRAREEEGEAERPRPGFIAELLAHPVYSLASQIIAQHFEAVARRRAVCSRALHWPAPLVSICLPQRLAVVCRGHLSALLVQKLICFRSERAVKHALKHATALLSRRSLKDHAADFTLQGHSVAVISVAFHPSAPYLATGSDDGTASFWLLNADCSAATCVSTPKP